MTNLDGYLSEIAQKIDPTALVIVNAPDTESESWLLIRNGHDDLGLGNSFKRANQAVHAWVKAMKNHVDGSATKTL